MICLFELEQSKYTQCTCNPHGDKAKAKKCPKSSPLSFENPCHKTAEMINNPNSNNKKSCQFGRICSVDSCVFRCCRCRVVLRYFGCRLSDFTLAEPFLLILCDFSVFTHVRHFWSPISVSSSVLWVEIYICCTTGAFFFSSRRQ